jgi:alkanesulfonate monooxygenase SsuD/methylene tetrahydromethanopterin reductase-like flavin-dependent oxidoreductase (luciferase family)
LDVALSGPHLPAGRGLPYASGSHFAPGALDEAVNVYRRDFRPSKQLRAPYVLAGVNVVAADSESEATKQLRTVQRARVRALLGRGAKWTDEEADAVLESAAGRAIQAMATYSAVGTRAEVRDYVERFSKLADADELITVHPAPTLDGRLRSIELLVSTSDA